MSIEKLTDEERGDIEDLPGRQSGCPDPTCGVCEENKRREAALSKLLRIYDDQTAALDRVEKVRQVMALTGAAHWCMEIAKALLERPKRETGSKP